MESVNLRIATADNGVMSVHAGKGYELLSVYLRADLVGVSGGPFPAVYAAALRGLQGVASDDITSNSCTVRVEGDCTVVEDDLGERELRLHTNAFKESLDVYARWATHGRWTAVDLATSDVHRTADVWQLVRRGATADGTQVLSSAPGFELVGRLLTSDLRDPAGASYAAVHQAVLQGVDGVVSEPINLPSYAVRVLDAVHLYEPGTGESLRVPTVAMLHALKVVAECL